MTTILPVGKLPHQLLSDIIQKAPTKDSSVLLGPGVGLDCAVIDHGTDQLLVYKTEPITFASRDIGWYAVQIAANDIATTGAVPRWILLTVLLPENHTTPELVHSISNQFFDTCRSLGITVIGGHSEITYGIDRPILVSTLIGEVKREKLVTPKGTKPGDRILLTKGIPIEATALLAREFPERLITQLTPQEIEQAQNYLFSPGISVLQDAQIAISAGHVTAMHDPTEGGLGTALWELAEASQTTLVIHPENIPISEISGKICNIFDLDPIGTIASGSLLLTAASADVDNIMNALKSNQIACAEIGWVEDGAAEVFTETNAGRHFLKRFSRDEIGRVYEGTQK